jgi:hypothetical protein
MRRGLFALQLEVNRTLTDFRRKEISLSGPDECVHNFRLEVPAAIWHLEHISPFRLVKGGMLTQIVGSSDHSRSHFADSN